MTDQLITEGWDIDNAFHEISEQGEYDDSSEADDSSVGGSDDTTGQIAVSWGDE